jgi:glyoxylase-like metal-dependent hydrolase (beta-lactamase superfamily II)
LPPQASIRRAFDVVLLSHVHPDHTNGIRALDGSMAFPNAEIMVPAVDWAFWTSEENASKAQSNEMMKNYFANVKKTFAGIESKVTKYDWGKEVVPGITSIEPPDTPRAIAHSRSFRAARKSLFSRT